MVTIEDNMKDGICFETERFKLIPFNLEDSELFLRINTTDFVKRYLWDDVSITIDLAKAIILENNKLFQEHGYGLWKIILKELNEVVGYTGLWFFFDESQPQLIYALLEDYSGRGIATESAKFIIDYAFKSLNFDYLIAANDESNFKSQKVCERIGMQLLERKLKDGKPTFFYRIDNRK